MLPITYALSLPPTNPARSHAQPHNQLAMATISQLAANQQNAQHSTGPQTDEGKAAVSHNAFKHGLSSPFDVLPHEDQEEFDALVESYRDEFQPVGQHRNFLVNQMAQARWQLARAQRLEACLLEQMMLDPGSPADSPDARIVANMLTRSADPIAALQRYAANAERSYHRAHREFRTDIQDGHKQQHADVEAMIHSIYALPREPVPAPMAAPAEAYPASTRPVPPSNLALRL